MEKNKEANAKNIILSLVLIVCAITVVFSAGALIISKRTDDNSKRISVVERTDYSRLRAQALAFCYRLQNVRDSQNNNSRAIFILSSEIAQSSRLASQNKSISKTKQQQQFRKEVADTYQHIADSIRHTDRTDCLQAVDHPLTYIAPKPKPFTQKDLPNIKFPEK